MAYDECDNECGNGCNGCPCFIDLKEIAKIREERLKREREEKEAELKKGSAGAHPEKKGRIRKTAKRRPSL